MKKTKKNNWVRSVRLSLIWWWLPPWTLRHVAKLLCKNTSELKSYVWLEGWLPGKSWTQICKIVMARSIIKFATVAPKSGWWECIPLHKPRLKKLPPFVVNKCQVLVYVHIGMICVFVNTYVMSCACAIYIKVEFVSMSLVQMKCVKSHCSKQQPS